MKLKSRSCLRRTVQVFKLAVTGTLSPGRLALSVRPRVEGNR